MMKMKMVVAVVVTVVAVVVIRVTKKTKLRFCPVSTGATHTAVPTATSLVEETPALQPKSLLKMMLC